RIRRNRPAADRQDREGEPRPERSMLVRFGQKVQEVPRRLERRPFPSNAPRRRVPGRHDRFVRGQTPFEPDDVKGPSRTIHTPPCRQKAPPCGLTTADVSALGVPIVRGQTPYEVDDVKGPSRTIHTPPCREKAPPCGLT